MRLGECIQTFQENQELLRPQFVADKGKNAIKFSIIESGKRGANRGQVIKIAELLQADVNELLAFKLAGNDYKIVRDVETAKGALKVDQNGLKYSKVDKYV